MRDKGQLTDTAQDAVRIIAFLLIDFIIALVVITIPIILFFYYIKITAFFGLVGVMKPENDPSYAIFIIDLWAGAIIYLVLAARTILKITEPHRYISAILNILKKRKALEPNVDRENVKDKR